MHHPLETHYELIVDESQLSILWTLLLTPHLTYGNYLGM